MSRARLLLVLAAVAVVAGVALPLAANARRAMALRAAADEVRSILLLARMRAAERDHEVAVRFLEVEGAWQHDLIDDGDGDGVRLDDITEGIDRPSSRARPVLMFGALVVAHVNEPALCVFTPDGGASPCVIAIADGGQRIVHVTQRGLS